MPPMCGHLQDLTVSEPVARECTDCVALGDSWVHLRMCMNCGKVGCCDQSKNTHARRHFEADGHAVIRSIEPGDSWVFCYIDEAATELADL